MAAERPSKLQVRLDDARETLRVLPERYEAAVLLGYALPGQQAGEARRSGKPVSAMPRGADVQLRAALVECGRGLADAHRACDRLDWPQPVWTPKTLGKAEQTVALVFRDTDELVKGGKRAKHGRCRRCGAKEAEAKLLHRQGRRRCRIVDCQRCAKSGGFDDEPAGVCLECIAHQRTLRPLLVWEWTPDADDLAVYPLTTVAAVCSQLDGMLATLTQGRLTALQRDVAYRSMGAVSRAVGAVRSVKAWEPPSFASECVVCGWTEVYSEDRCEACYRYKLRNRVDRPRHLWAA